MSLIDNLNTLDTNIEEERGKLLTNLSNKGVTVQPTDTLSVMVDNVKNIEAGGINWEDVGYDEEPKPIADKHKLIAQWYSEWDPANTVLNTTFTDKHPECDIFPLIDTSNVTDMSFAFEGSNLIYVPQLDTSKVTHMNLMFSQCKKLTECNLSGAKYMVRTFSMCDSLKRVKIINIQIVNNFAYLFENCTSLQEVWLKGQPQYDLNITGMFDGVTTTGTLYYDNTYDYSVIINVLPSGWTAQSWNYDTNSPA